MIVKSIEKEKESVYAPRLSNPPPLLRPPIHLRRDYLFCFYLCLLQHSKVGTYGDVSSLKPAANITSSCE